MAGRGAILGVAWLAMVARGACAQNLNWDGECDDLWNGSCLLGTDTNWSPDELPDNTKTCTAVGADIRVFGAGHAALSLSTTGGTFQILNNADLTLGIGGTIANASIQGALIASGPTTLTGSSTLGGGGRLVGAGPFCAIDSLTIGNGNIGFGATPTPPVTLTSKDNLFLTNNVNIASGCLLVNQGEAQSTSATGITGDTFRNEDLYSMINTLVDITAVYQQASGRTVVRGGQLSLLSANAEFLGGTMTLAMNGIIKLRAAVTPAGGHVFDGLTAVAGDGHVEFDAPTIFVRSALMLDLMPLDTSARRGFELRAGSTVQMDADIVCAGLSRFAGAIAGDGAFTNTGDMLLIESIFSAPFVNDGELTQQSGTQDEVQIGPGGSVTNNSLWLHRSGTLRRTGGAGRFLNKGILERLSDTTAILEIRTPFDQDAGSMLLGGADVHAYSGGAWSNESNAFVDEGVTLRYRSGTYTFSGGGNEFTGPGVVHLGNWFDPVSFVLEPGAELATSLWPEGFRLDFRAGITGIGTVRNTGWFEWFAGPIGSAPEPTRFENDGFLLIVPGISGQVLRGDLVNRSAGAPTNGVTQRATLVVEAGSSLTNEGDWRLRDGADITGPASVVLVNTGHLGASGAPSYSVIQPALDNTGRVESILGATLELQGPIAQLADGVLLGGEWVALFGGRILFPTPITKIGPMAGVVGGFDSIPALDGLERVEGWLVVDGTLDLDGRLESLGGSRVTVVGGATVIAPEGVENGLPPGVPGGPSVFDLWTTPWLNPFDKEEAAERGAIDKPRVVTPLFENHAVLVPGGDGRVGAFVIDGELMLSQTSTIDVDLAAAGPVSEHDVLEVTGPATLGGTLRVHFVDGYTPDPGDEFVVLTASLIAGEFDDTVCPAFGGRTLRPAYSATAVTLVETCAADLAEPFGVLDFSDVLAFLAAFGAMTPGADLAEPLGEFDFSDVLGFLVAYGSGCP